MPSKNTVLILGAGASRPYYFPTAYELRQIIIGERLLSASLRDANGGMQLYSDVPTSHDQIKISLGHRVAEPNFRKFLKEFQRSDLYSVDRFCFEWPEFADYAKAFIASILLRCEAQVDPFGDWYQQLWNTVIYPSLSDGSPPLDIITFNYDRSLEQYLHRVFRAVKQLAHFKEHVRIHHVYGSLGDIDSQVNYGAYQNMESAASHIKLLPPRAEGLENLKEVLVNSEQAVFLGFGFDSLNIQALGINDKERPKRIWASQFHLPANDGARAEAALGKIEWGKQDQDVRTFLHARYIHQ